MNSINYLKSLGRDVDFGDLDIVLKSILHGSDINLKLFDNQFCNAN